MIPPNRRDLLKGSIAATAMHCNLRPLNAEQSLSSKKDRGLKSDKFHVVTTITSLQNPFYQHWDQGARAFARSVGANYIVLENQGKSEKLIDGLNEIIGRTEGKMILRIDMASRFQAANLVDLLFKNRIYFTTHSYRKPEVHPWDNNPFYVAHTASDHVLAGMRTASELIAAMGGKGRVVGLGGIASEYASQKRKAGLDKAVSERAGCKILEFQAADWQSSAAFDVTRYCLSKYRGQVDGIWAANDEMALGAIEALRVYGAAGKIPVVGLNGHPLALEAIKSGELTATIPWDAYYMAAVGLQLANEARLLSLSPATEPDEHREFYIKSNLVNRSNILHYEANIDTGLSRNLWTDPWARADGKIVD